MTTELPETVTVAKAIREDLPGYGSIVGDSRVDDQERWILGLGLSERSGYREIDVVEGETFEFAGAVWQVTKVNEPSTRTRGSVAKLTRISEPAD